MAGSLDVLYHIELDMSGEKRMQRIHVKQYDPQTRKIQCKLTFQGNPYTIPSEAHARSAFSKPSGLQVLNDETIENGEVVIWLTEQMLAEHGVGTCEVQLYISEKMISSAVFEVVINKSAADRSKIESSEEYTTFIDSLAETKEVTEKANAATTAANAAAAKAEKAAKEAVAATITVGTVETGAPGTTARVTNTGTESAAVLDFVIPRGEKGDKGDKGDKGEQGYTAVTSLAPGMFAMSVNQDGHLILTHNDNEPTPPFSVKNGHLIYTIS